MGKVLCLFKNSRENQWKWERDNRIWGAFWDYYVDENGICESR
jgi:hypothetical protein